MKRRLLAQRMELVVPSAEIQPFLPALRCVIRRMVPIEFHWWVEMEEEVGVSVRWIWLGHPGNSRIGGVSDPDCGICLELLKLVDWQEEVEAAMLTVEAVERDALIAAQKRRRTIVDGLGKPPPIKLLPSLSTVEEKRDAARVSLAQSLKQRRYNVAPYRPELLAEDWRRDLGLVGQSELPQLCLSRSRSARAKYCEWVECEDETAFWQMLYSHEDYTFTRGYFYGCHWVGEMLYYVARFPQMRPLIPFFVARELSPEEFRVRLTGVRHIGLRPSWAWLEVEPYWSAAQTAPPLPFQAICRARSIPRESAGG